MVFVTRTEHFSAAHRLYNPVWTDARNDEVFGKCNSPNGHGHNYILEVTVGGDIDPDTGYVIDLKLLKDILHREVIEQLDHRNLNTDVPFLADVIPTAENIAVAIWKRLERALPSGRLIKVVLHETVNNVVEYRGEA